MDDQTSSYSTVISATASNVVIRSNLYNLYMLQFQFVQFILTVLLILPTNVGDDALQWSFQDLFDQPICYFLGTSSKVELARSSSRQPRVLDSESDSTASETEDFPERQYETFSVAKLADSSEVQLSEDLTRRQARIETCLQHYYQKPVNADQLRPWSILHGVLGYGQDAIVSTRGKDVNAIEYLCANGIGHDRRLLMLNGHNLSVAVGIGFQGHEGQLLAILGQVKTPLDQELVINNQKFTVEDLVEYEKLGCRPNSELTFKLIGLLNYLPSDAVWSDSSGGKWDLSRMIYEELRQPINGAACGGTHRLMGLSYAVETRKARNEPLDGQWKRADTFVQSYINKVFELQNSDGGFSTEFFEGRSNTQDRIRQIYSTGHVLEWLMIALSDQQLEKPEVGRMVDFLLDLMEAEYRPNVELNGTDVGPKNHALRALRLYELRVYGQPSDHMKLRREKGHQLVDAEDVINAQAKIRTVLPSVTSESSNAITPSSHPSPPRGGRFMRRR